MVESSPTLSFVVDTWIATRQASARLMRTRGPYAQAESRRQRLPLLYLDTNQAVRAFQRDRGIVLFCIRLATWLHVVRLVVSDVLMVELIKAVDEGGRREDVRAVVERIGDLNPRWLLLDNLEREELILAWEDSAAGRPFRCVTPLLAWPQAAERIAKSTVGDNPEIWRGRSMSELFVDAYDAGSINKRHAYWAKELQAGQEALRASVGAAQELEHATRRLVQDIAASEATAQGAGAEAAQDLGKLLWQRPDVCPAFRLNVELTVRSLWDKTRDWKINDFLDLKHACAVPYVDAFVTERGLLSAVQAFSRSRQSGEQDPYSARVVRRLEDVPRVLLHRLLRWPVRQLGRLVRHLKLKS